MQKEKFLYLLKKHLSNTCSLSEKESLYAMMAEINDNDLLSNWMEEAWQSFTPEETLTQQEADAYFNAIVAASPQKIQERSSAQADIRTIVRYWQRIAAVLLFAIVGAAIWLFINHNADSAATADLQGVAEHDVLPGGNYATLTLSDGTRVILDSVSNGLVASEGSAKIIKLDNGKLVYENGGVPNEALYNTMSTPTGGQYKLMLPDGTAVWLNAASSITYPVAFTGMERNVSITGEVYFEVKKNAAIPFKVKVNGQVIEVLGTHFNVNAYDNEDALKTTLAEGAVKLTSGSNFMLLAPGQQAQRDKSGHFNFVGNPDMEETLAWKDGLFRYNGADIATIMKDAARWYGVDVVYKNKIEETFVAEIPRNVKLSKLLELLELTKQVHFNVEGRTVTVTH